MMKISFLNSSCLLLSAKKSLKKPSILSPILGQLLNLISLSPDSNPMTLETWLIANFEYFLIILKIKIVIFLENSKSLMLGYVAIKLEILGPEFGPISVTRMVYGVFHFSFSTLK